MSITEIEATEVQLKPETYIDPEGDRFVTCDTLGGEGYQHVIRQRSRESE